MRQDVEFVSEGVTLRGWLYLPEGAGTHGAVVLTEQFDLLGFGAKIVRKKGSPQVERHVIGDAHLI